ncbi:helix-turn-helix domain-containing protein [Paenibacillus sp. GCM10012307]|uniref:helix-turn-helix domain-containing protein n=1 Tax=Paenibacillus TaxID=44249 RepID=UPI0036226EFB
MPAHIGKQIILDLYINDKSEKQIAQELNISQQAVNKWKQKMLNTLNQKMSF